MHNFRAALVMWTITSTPVNIHSERLQWYFLSTSVVWNSSVCALRSRVYQTYGANSVAINVAVGYIQKGPGKTSESLSSVGNMCLRYLGIWSGILWLFNVTHTHMRLMMTSSKGNIFRVAGPLCVCVAGGGGFTGHRWISLTKASDAELWCCLWSTPE